MPVGRVDSVSPMSQLTPPLSGRRILVTGAATGIGAAAVGVLAEAGAAVAATYHQTPPPDHLAATWLQCDVRDADAVTAMVRQAAEHLGGLDVLVNAAGLWQAGIPGFISADDISFLLDTNVKATILTNQAAHAVMKDQDPKGGRIINFGSSEAVMGSPISAVYAATKGAVQAWTRSAAKTWAADNVTVNALAPAVQTAGADRLRDFLGPDAAALIDQQMKMMIPLGGALGEPARDLGPMLVFLAGSGSGFITGQLLAVDGGLMMVGG
ncbi:NAD(P)-dependent dehydrogenase, short-chain alcohol dehydrogenase family [Mycobacterium numidiamassiliense]|uniref:NAD(P)-dependent dehydrogenase, short-chain alcohol dehydrogenase family n=1 Tax=Mycobacterium numidiamassiliense TaxID=1841861 RepID=A0A2U3P6I4_9MYCO|nr:NAD(P)-dependent dehydrogenase, short-chain alcohol dehydrogenase family [Mycobacterium numidiamassiliense]